MTTRRQFLNTAAVARVAGLLGDCERQAVEGVKGWRVFDVQDASSRSVRRL